MPMPNQDVMKLWVEALESGEYEQGKGSLRYIDDEGAEKLCCLGVLCDIAAKNAVIVAPEWLPAEHAENNPDIKIVPRRAKYGEQTGILPYAVADWAGFTSQYNEDRNDPTVHTYLSQSGNSFGEKQDAPLTMLNDLYDWSFTDIANIVREQYMTEENANA